MCVDMRMGKGWAKGLTARTDQRVAARAAAHRGLQYTRRTPPEDCKWPLAGRTTLPLEWSAEMAYVVGLTATDGCLYTGTRKINFKSMDRQLVETYLRLLGRTNRVKDQETRTGNIVYFTEFGDAALYRWFQSVGLMPRKSLVLGQLEVPRQFLLPLARGLLDGDGSIINKTYRADTGRRSDYYWEYLLTKFTSASKQHLEWLAERIKATTGCEGYLSEATRRVPDPKRHPFFHLRYGKRASLALLPLLYPEGAPCLERKRQIWIDYKAKHRIADTPVELGLSPR